MRDGPLINMCKETWHYSVRQQLVCEKGGEGHVWMDHQNAEVLVAVAVVDDNTATSTNSRTPTQQVFLFC